ncbi:hypothetical protein BD626DRAFT_579564 [Schizophyllum amplum]|uniref:Uncharacterized protein n=1 Tax=Schizophyllum amplum TaxID=97359 RepID=A0A550BRD3_9AGAR|nr:hypothetical protein BD626DRAFT_579564 [Auriculariopsis ampla]
MRDPERRRASKREYYARNKLRLQEAGRERYAERRAKGAAPEARVPRRRRIRTGRDPELRKASKAAYYARHRSILQQKARKRMSLLHSSRDADALRARQRAAQARFYAYYEPLRLRRLNLYRKKWMTKHGVARFLEKFRGRTQADKGTLLEHWDYDTLTTVINTPQRT